MEEWVSLVQHLEAEKSIEIFELKTIYVINTITTLSVNYQYRTYSLKDVWGTKKKIMATNTS